MSYEQIAINGQQTADNLVDTNDPMPVLKRGSENVKIKLGPEVVRTRDTSTDTIWGRFNWGESNWDGTYDNSPVVFTITNQNNTYLEYFTTTQLSDANTTALGWGTGTLTFDSITPIFSDTFDRADSDTVGNGWTESNPGYCSIQSNALLVQSLGGSNIQAIHTLATPPTYVSVKMKVDGDIANEGGTFRLQEGGANNILIHLGRSVINYMDFAAGGALVELLSPAVANQWYTLEFKNIDYTTKTLDIYIDGVEKKHAMPFAPGKTTIDTTWLNSWGGTNDVWYNDFVAQSGSDSLVAQSSSVAYNVGTIKAATITITGTGTENLTLYAVADGVSDWEECTSGVRHVFTNVGSNIKWKIVATAEATITKLIINYEV